MTISQTNGNVPSVPRFHLNLFRTTICFIAIVLVAYCIVMRPQARQTANPSRVLDLTEKVAAAEAGFPGIPGESFGGPIGQIGRPRYQIPIEIQILSVSGGNDADFTIDVMVRNIGTTEFDLPSSKNLTSIERPGNKGQRLFFFHVRPATEKSRDVESMAVIATGGSTTVPNSFSRLAPGASLRVLLPASAEMIRRVLNGSTKQLEVRVECDEWQLGDARYFITASSNRAASKDIIKFVLRDGKPTVLQP